ncbi:YgiQ family radical SAM protein [Coprococcus sp. AM14-16]|uniref:YgiQ family radical SAM protein n=1 Tax=Coprococcus TaxID=33042 RepID=UPI000E3FEEEE|nr:MULTISPECIES: YgiQ family radical SAM protein [Coprococcus]RGD40974.1 YgiQ family radical SAM protein [Coprococcus sp. AM14-16]RJV47729.1 YgiQ family radical SAM protein [Coprococcus sp. AF19-8AC]
MERDYLPICMEDMKKRGWTQADFVFVIGDAYVDHPSFGPAIISRLLERYGYKVCMIAQPDWKNDKSIDVFGRPRLGFLVCGGNMDSMVNHYSVSKKRRQKDAYSPGGEMGLRPDYATTVYCNLIRRTYKDVPIIIGGIEASLRRMAHYDYWSDKLKHSILVDSSADILSYGMGEHSMIEIAEALDSGIDVKDITFVRGTCYRTKDISGAPEDSIILPDYDSLSKDRLEYARSFYTQYINTDPYSAKTLVEGYGNRGYVVQNPPAYPLTQMEMDDVYDLPYMNNYHPIYEEAGGIPAISEIKFSLTSNRGCFGGCSFCALTFHQGRIIQTRSHESLIKEAERMTHDPDFKGYIHDVGGPTANFRHKSCAKQDKYGVCTNKQCLFPEPCRNLKVDHKDYVELLRKLEAVPGVKKVFIRSGIRFDYVMADSNDEFLKELCEKHISGQLRVAPEHVSDNVLRMMGKPQNSVYEKFIDRYKRVNAKTGKQQYVVPYLMSSHPGSTLKEAVELAEYVRDIGYMPEQVQDFYPTPSTISTCMYYTGVDPRTMKPVYVPHNPHEKAMQKALMMYRKPENYDLVKEALIKAGRQDLIGFDKKCLIAPRKMDRKGEHQGQRSYGKNDKSKNNSINNGKNSKNNKVVPQKNTKSSGQKNAKNGKNRNKRK